MPYESPDNNINNLAHGAGFGLIGKFLGRFLSILGDIIAARILGPAVFGLYSIGWTLFRLVEIIAPLGLDRGVLRFIPRSTSKESNGAGSIVLQSMGLSFVFGTLLGCVFYWISPWLAHFVFKKPELVFILRFFAVGFPLGALLPVAASITRAKHSVKYAVLVQDIGQPLLAIIILGALYLTSAKLISVLYADIVSYALSVLWALVYVRRLYPQILEWKASSFQFSRDLLNYSIQVAIGGVFSSLIYWVDRLFIGYFLSSTETGIYQAASQISLIFAVVLSGLSTVLAPQFSNLYYHKDQKKLRQVYSIGNKWGLYIGLPIIAVILISPERILSVLFGNEYSSGWLPMVILLLGQSVNLATGASAPLLVMAGEQRIWLKLTFITFIVDLLLNLYLTPMLGMIGSALATAISVSLLYISVLCAVRVKFDISPYDRRYIKGIVAVFMAICITWVIGKTMLPDLAILIIQTITSISIFGSVLFVLKLDAEDLVFIDLIRKQLFRMVRINREI